jgi:Icc-related predicted phosphoesterase
MKIVALSDTHTKHNQITIPKGDILIYAGDFEIRNTIDLVEMRDWLNKLNFKYIITIFGNHDFTDKATTNYIKDVFGKKINYLCNNAIIIEGLKIWGSSYSPLFNDWAWMKPDNDLKEIWNIIPNDVDIVVTHCPCYGILDKAQPMGENLGSLSLRDKIKGIKPKVHLCGHIHGGYGQYTDYKTDYYNCSLLDEQYKLVNEPVIITI